jgi:glycosyltransferase involved in cell wall biosynthesis
MKKNIGFISFRLSGTDGVSLETKKWADIFERNNCTCYYFGGELDAPPERSFVVPEAHFTHPEIKELYNLAFSRATRPRELTQGLHKYRVLIKDALYEFVNKYRIDLLIPENAITIPLNISLGLAITEFIAETGIYTIAHHHDFFWERKRFLHNCVWDYLNQCYPAHLNTIKHVVINSSGANQLALRTGISSTLIPNVMEFERPAPGIDEYNADVREALGVGKDELLILQPTRVVQRKGIEHAIELVARMELPATLVISHASGDEGYEYQERIREYAEMMKVRALFVDDVIKDRRGTTPDGRKIYVLEDIYPHADLVTYPSLIEGFGNAFLETVWFRKPIMVNNYSIYATDIKPKGFQVIEMDDFISRATLARTEEILADRRLAKDMADHNYALGLKHYSYGVLKSQLKAVVTRHWGDLALENRS